MSKKKYNRHKVDDVLEVKKQKNARYKKNLANTHLDEKHITNALRSNDIYSLIEDLN